EGAPIDGRVNQFRRRIDERRRQLREMQERALIKARSDALAQGRDEAHDPAVVLRAINQRRKMTASIYFRGEREKTRAWIGQAMQHANRTGVIRSRIERKVKEVSY